MPDLTTEYLGLRLANPIVASSSPLTEQIDDLRRLEASGAAAVVLPSLFEEQISIEGQDLDLYLAGGTQGYAEALAYFPDMWGYNQGPAGSLKRLSEAKAALRIPVIASLNGVSRGGWTAYARRMEEAGADALELNVYFLPTDPTIGGEQVERMYLDLVEEVVASIRIPVAVKLSPFLSAPAQMARRLGDAGARGLVLFNRFYQPDIDLDRMEIVPALDLSSASTLRLRLRWTAVIFGHTSADLAITGGVQDAPGVLKSVMAGARVAMMASALLRHGPPHITRVLQDLESWMTENQYDSIGLMRGSMSQRACAEPAAYERANYLRVLKGFSGRGE